MFHGWFYYIRFAPVRQGKEKSPSSKTGFSLFFACIPEKLISRDRRLRRFDSASVYDFNVRNEIRIRLNVVNAEG